MANQGMIGANIDELRALAGEFDAAANQIDGELWQVTSCVKNTSWLGLLADEFRRIWNAVHTLKLHTLANELHEAARVLRANADEQEKASRDNGGSSKRLVPVPPHNPIPTPSTTPDGPVITGHRDLADVLKSYDADKNLGQNNADGKYPYQCTGWANHRWHELGHSGTVYGDGWELAGKAGTPVSSSPSLHAMGSAPGGPYGNGHVMIVEEIKGNQIRVSEMNAHDTGYQAGSDPVGRPAVYNDTLWITQQADGTYRYPGMGTIQFAAFSG